MIKLYSIFEDTIVILMKAKALINEKNYIAPAMSLFSILKTVYESLKLAKDIHKLVKYYKSSKKNETK